MNRSNKRGRKIDMIFGKKHILIVDDDVQICDLVSDYLERHGFRVTAAANGIQMKSALGQHMIDLVILDVMLPGEDGLSLCRGLREKSPVPIIMLSAVGEETDRVVGLEMGADDYLPKPFGPRELLARIKALLRRGDTQMDLGEKRLAALPDIQFLEWRLDRNRRHLLAPDGVAVPLSSGEYDLLLAFIANIGRTLSRDQLLDLTRGKEASPFDRSIDVQVGRLRKKIEDDPKSPKIIVTVRGGGYCFNAAIDKVD